MDYSSISEEVKFRFEGGDTSISFSYVYWKGSPKPTPAVLDNKIVQIQLPYAYSSRQDRGITALKKAFEANRIGVITKIPDNLISCQDDVFILKCGTTELDPLMLTLAKKAGVSGYWDRGNLIICVSAEYKTLMERIREFLRPNETRFVLKAGCAGSDLMLINI